MTISWKPGEFFRHPSWPEKNICYVVKQVESRYVVDTVGPSYPTGYYCHTYGIPPAALKLTKEEVIKIIGTLPKHYRDKFGVKLNRNPVLVRLP